MTKSPVQMKWPWSRHVKTCRGIAARMAVALAAGILMLSASGCCTAVLHGTARQPEPFQGFTGAYCQNDELLVSYATARGPKNMERYAVLKPAAEAARHRGPVPKKWQNQSRDLVGVESRDAALSYADKAAVLWWRPDAYKPLYSFMWDAPGGPFEKQLSVEHSYVPLREYPKLVLLTPFALALDIVTLPVQALVLGLVWSVDWTAPYT